MREEKNIFITGAHRSGTSWVGRMIAASGGFLVRDEEIFNCVSQIADFPFRAMYACVTEENEREFYPFIRRSVENRYRMIPSLLRVRRPRDIARVAKRKLRSLARRVVPPRRTIFIEPIGLFSADWFQKRFETENIVVIRHPAAFVSSLKKLRWGFDFNHLKDQPLLMKKYLNPFLKELSNPPVRPDYVGIGILVWKVLYGAVFQLQKEHPDWIFLRHEDLAADPVAGFEALYKRLGLPFTPAVRRVVEEHSSPDNPAEFSGRQDNSRRNSRETIAIWKKRLAPQEIDRIRRGVEEVSRHFYDDEHWS